MTAVGFRSATPRDEHTRQKYSVVSPQNGPHTALTHTQNSRETHNVNDQ